MFNSELGDEECADWLQEGYTFGQKLNEGTNSQVYLVTDDNAASGTSNQLACKVIDIKNQPSDFRTKFLAREMDIMSKIRHPHIIHMHCILQRGSKFMIFMRHAEQGNLFDYLLLRGALSESTSRVWARQMAVALQYLHTLNIVHRDLKCENILVTCNSNVKIGDFGFSRFTVDSRGRAVKCTTFCGSLPYSAPELIKGLSYDPMKTDVWSLGVVFFIVLNRRMPFKTDNLPMLWINQIKKNYRFRKQVQTSISEEAVKLVERMLEPEAKLRAVLGEVIASPWFTSDPSLRSMSEQETEAMRTAQSVKNHIYSLNFKKLKCSKETDVLAKNPEDGRRSV